MPVAVVWYRIYCIFHAVFNLALFGISAWFVLRHSELENTIVSGNVILIVGLICAPLSLVLAGTNIVLFRAKKLKNAWAVHMSNIVVGIASCFLAPVAIPLLLAWFRPDVRAYFEQQE